MALYVLNERDLPALFDGLPYKTIYGPVQEGETTALQRLTPEGWPSLALRGPRVVESPKSVLFPVKEKVAEYPGEHALPEPSAAQSLYLGARACDLEAVRILDQIFLEGDFRDPFYAARRSSTVFASVDCVNFAPTCFCTLLGGKPFVEQAADLNLTPIDGAFVVEVVSDAGKEIALAGSQLLEEATPEQASQRDAVRSKAHAALSEQNEQFALPEQLPQIIEQALQTDEVLSLVNCCVECGGCSFVCPTCHCFQLYDQLSDAPGEGAERVKAWDSCVYGSFARMAGVGGMKATPSPDLQSRFLNRIQHKFIWMYENLQRIGCVGCGRCMETCLGGSDLREVLSSAAKVASEK